MRTTWNGAISFGLVTIPVGLAPATKPAARQSDVSFRLLHRECKTPIKQKRWCPTHDREVGPDEIVRGWEVAKGEFVIVEDADLEAIDRDTTSRAIDIRSFVPAADGRPDLLRPHVLPRPGQRGGAAAAVRPAARGDARDADGRARELRACGEGEARAHPGAGRRARAGDAVRRGGRLLRRRDRGGRRGREDEEAGGRARAPGDRQPRRGVRPEGARQRVPARPAGAARGEARGRAAGEARGRGGGRKPRSSISWRRFARASPTRRSERRRPRSRLPRSGRPPARRPPRRRSASLAQAFAAVASSCAWKSVLSILPW